MARRSTWSMMVVTMLLLPIAAVVSVASVPAMTIQLHREVIGVGYHRVLSTTVTKEQSSSCDFVLVENFSSAIFLDTMDDPPVIPQSATRLVFGEPDVESLKEFAVPQLGMIVLPRSLFPDEVDSLTLQVPIHFRYWLPRASVNDGDTNTSTNTNTNTNTNTSITDADGNDNRSQTLVLDAPMAVYVRCDGDEANNNNDYHVKNPCVDDGTMTFEQCLHELNVGWDKVIVSSKQGTRGEIDVACVPRGNLSDARVVITVTMIVIAVVTVMLGRTIHVHSSNYNHGVYF